MDYNNPAEMSNKDLEKDMELKNQENPDGNQEMTNKSTAAEGTLKEPESDESTSVSVKTAPKQNSERGFNEQEHLKASEKDSQDGSAPDPEALDNWENNDDDVNKISS